MLKIGDRVRAVETENIKDDEVGRTGLVVDINPEDTWPITVLYDVPGVISDTGLYEENELELIND